MKDRAFFYTNVLIYLFSEDEPEKNLKCISALKKYTCITSTQAINELCNVFTKKWRLPVKDIQFAIKQIEAVCDIQFVDLDVVDYALEIKGKYKYSYYNCLMLSSAIISGCDYILSEDMHSGQ